MGKVFDNLHETRENLLFEIQKRSKEFEGKTNPTNVYVLAEEKLQEKIWQDMQQHLNLGVLPKDISAEIYMSLIRGILRDAKTEEIQSKR